MGNTILNIKLLCRVTTSRRGNSLVSLFFHRYFSHRSDTDATGIMHNYNNLYRFIDRSNRWNEQFDHELGASLGIEEDNTLADPITTDY